MDLDNGNVAAEFVLDAEQATSFVEDVNCKPSGSSEANVRMVEDDHSLRDASVLAVVGESYRLSRFVDLSWLVIGTLKPSPTGHDVYIFDVQKLGLPGFDNGLRAVLELDDILKICHDCRLLSDCLAHRYKTSLNNVWDTQVAKSLVLKNRTGMFNVLTANLRDLVRHYFDVHLPNVDKKLWKNRPLTDNLRTTLVNDVVFLPRLRQILLNELNKDFNHLTSLYCDFKHVSDDSVREAMAEPSSLHSDFIDSQEKLEKDKFHVNKRILRKKGTFYNPVTGVIIERVSVRARNPPQAADSENNSSSAVPSNENAAEVSVSAIADPIICEVESKTDLLENELPKTDLSKKHVQNIETSNGTSETTSSLEESSIVVIEPKKHFKQPKRLMGLGRGIPTVLLNP